MDKEIYEQIIRDLMDYTDIDELKNIKKIVELEIEKRKTVLAVNKLFIEG